MEFVLVAIGSGGDVYPFLGLALELRRRGHSVAMVANGHFRAAIERHGIAFEEYGTDEQYRQALNNPDLWHPIKGFKTVMGYNDHQRELLATIRKLVGRDGVVIAHTLAFAARILHETGELRSISVCLQPAVLRSVHEGPIMTGSHGITRLPRWMQHAFWWSADRFLVDPVVRPMIEPIRSELGLLPQRHYFAQWLHSPLLTVGLFPDWFAPPQPDWPASVRLASFPLVDTVSGRNVPDELNRLLETQRPVVITPGTGNIQAYAFLAAAVETCLALHLYGVILTPHRDQLPPSLPADVRHFPFAPLSQILSRCAALIHHGGIGTTAAALAGGIPQIIMPLSHDQPDNAARVVRNGWGARLWPRRFDARRLTPLLQDVLASGGIARNCRIAAAQLSQTNGLSSACELIESALR